MDLGEYQLILDKQLLGSKTPPIQKKVIPPPENRFVPPWGNKYMMTMISKDQDKLRVGIQNVEDKSAILLLENEETHPDYKLISGNFERGTAIISYRNQIHKFQIQSGPRAPVRPTPPSQTKTAPTQTTTAPRGVDSRKVMPPVPVIRSRPGANIIRRTITP